MQRLVFDHVLRVCRRLVEVDMYLHPTCLLGVDEQDARQTSVLAVDVADNMQVRFADD